MQSLQRFSQVKSEDHKEKKFQIVDCRFRNFLVPACVNLQSKISFCALCGERLSYSLTGMNLV